MAMFINANYTGWFAMFADRNGGLGFNRAGKRILLKEANRKTVQVWHDKFIPPHFDAAAAGRYHYQRRKGPYRGIKVRLAKGEKVIINGKEIDPEVIRKSGLVSNVRTGEMEAEATSPTAVTATPFRAITRVLVPAYVTKRRPGQPDQVKEMQKLTRMENNHLQRVWRAKFLRGGRQVGHLFRLKRRLGSRSGSI